MIIVVPISHVDFKRGCALLGRFLDLQLTDPHVLVTCTWADHFDVGELFKQWEARYKNTDFFIMPDVPEDEGWPKAGNHMFYQSCLRLHKQGNKEPFYFFEADNFPLYVGWDKELSQEYTEAGLPYMGAVNVSRFSEDGKTVERGKHMVGTGIYPANFLEICEKVHTLDEDPWDIAIQDEVLPCCHETQKIHHAWSTGGYHYKGDQLTAEPRNPYNRYGGPVKNTAVVIHGCKDMSLYTLFGHQSARRTPQQSG